MPADLMNKKNNTHMPSTVSDAPSATAAPVQTAGAWLREVRQQRGLHIAALAAMLKVPQAKLEALEATVLTICPTSLLPARWPRRCAVC